MEHRPVQAFPRLVAAGIDGVFILLLAALLTPVLGLHRQWSAVFDLTQPRYLEQMVDSVWASEFEQLDQAFQAMDWQTIPPSTRIRISEILQLQTTELQDHLKDLRLEGLADISNFTQKLKNQIQGSLTGILDRMEEEKLEGINEEEIRRLRSSFSQVLDTQSLWDLVAAFLWRLGPLILSYLWIYLGYHAFEGLFGASPGKMVFAMRISDSGGNRTHVFTYLIRAIFGSLSALALWGAFAFQSIPLLVATPIVYLLINLIGNLLLLGPRRRTLVDRFSNSAVYFKRAMNQS